MPAKTAEKAENHSKEGPINTSIGKSRARRVFPLGDGGFFIQLQIQLDMLVVR